MPAAGVVYLPWVVRLLEGMILQSPHLITAVGVASGIVFFGERLGVEKVVGGAVILLGVYLARRQ